MNSKWSTALLLGLAFGATAQEKRPTADKAERSTERKSSESKDDGAMSVEPAERADQFAAKPNPGYSFKRDHDPNGTGKFYLGREIALVMGHEGWEWLERPEREEEEEPIKMVEALELKAGEVAADVGAGSGYVTWMLSKKVGDQGKIYAVDIQPEMLALLRVKMKKLGVVNVEPTQGTTQNPKLPADALDLIVMVDVYHEFSHPYEMVAEMTKSLKEGGRLVFVEYRKEDPEVPIKEVHKMSVEQVKKEMSLFALEYQKTVDVLPRQHIIIFAKKKRAIDDAEKNPKNEADAKPSARPSDDSIPAPTV
jgi:ubiquinone/menaquinone biosynthesis C-methylase UbiE